jgi:hypothetical protein
MEELSVFQDDPEDLGFFGNVLEKGKSLIDDLTTHLS